MEEDGWKKVSYHRKKVHHRLHQQKFEASLIPARATSFFLANLPEYCQSSLIWKICMPLGKIVDVYVANRKCKQGTNFGFVRFVNINDANLMIDKLKTIKIDGAKIHVNVAKWEKNKKTIEHRPPSKAKLVHTIPSMQPVVNQFSQVNQNRSYRDVAQGKVATSSVFLRKVTLPSTTAWYPEAVKHRSLIGEVKNIQTLCNIKVILREEGLENFAISYIGGLCLLLVFKTSSETKEVLENHKTTWANSFSKLEIWKGQSFTNSRIAGLKIHGLPIQLRDDQNYNKIGELFGSLIWPSDFSWNVEDNSIGSCHVLVSDQKRIDEQIQVSWRNETISIWVIEDPNVWTPNLVDEESFVQKLGDEDGEINHQPLDDYDDDVEDGEFRPYSKFEEDYSGDSNDESIQESRIRKQNSGECVDKQPAGDVPLPDGVSAVPLADGVGDVLVPEVGVPSPKVDSSNSKVIGNVEDLTHCSAPISPIRASPHYLHTSDLDPHLVIQDTFEAQIRSKPNNISSPTISYSLKAHSHPNHSSTNRLGLKHSSSDIPDLNILAKSSCPSSYVRKKKKNKKLGRKVAKRSSGLLSMNIWKNYRTNSLTSSTNSSYRPFCSKPNQLISPTLINRSPSNIPTNSGNEISSCKQSSPQIRVNEETEKTVEIGKAIGFQLDGFKDQMMALIAGHGQWHINKQSIEHNHCTYKYNKGVIYSYHYIVFQGFFINSNMMQGRECPHNMSTKMLMKWRRNTPPNFNRFNEAVDDYKVCTLKSEHSTNKQRRDSAAVDDYKVN
ncbi:hypothetical protein E3N88_35459 [Mikania micrantha]|uniref:RRM domain-containing protein n=1 Tax=Mikania micrantha TaxID=192012 RepID=A0A5N6M102_9ASTR|nr:hypothetical protein E3N88_35459 [Mikania micrantha]